MIFLSFYSKEFFQTETADGKGGGESGFGISCFDIDYQMKSQNFVYNVMSRQQEEWKGQRESDKERILKSMVAQNGEMSLKLFQSSKKKKKNDETWYIWF